MKIWTFRPNEKKGEPDTLVGETFAGGANAKKRKVFCLHKNGKVGVQQKIQVETHLSSWGGSRRTVVRKV